MSAAQKFPSLFVSHGAPNLALHNSEARDFLESYGRQLGKPKAILIATAHFESGTPFLTADRKPEMIYDFGGFEPELYKMTYHAPGDPDLAQQAAALLAKAGMKAQAVTGRGYDHGTWVPLKLLYPDADVPVVQLSVQPQAGAAHHVAMGRALAPLREQGILVMGSGGTTHNLGEFFRGGYKVDSAVPGWVSEFGDWVHGRIEAGAVDDIANYRKLGPSAAKNHPSEEHFMPLPFAFGAGGEGARGTRVHSSHQYGVLMMDAYAFG